MKNDIIVEGYPPYPRIINFFKLRLELFFFALSFVLLFLVVYFFRLQNSINTSDFVDFRKLEMVEIKIPVSKTQTPKIVTTEETEEEEERKEKKKEKKDDFKFGDDSGHFDISALAATPPKPKIKILPPYPKSMRKAGIEGTVVIEVGIDENGTVIYGKIIKRVHPVLDKLVLNWMRKVSFYPAMDQNSKTFRCKIYWPVRFALTD